MNYYVYILKCSDGTYYTGVTNYLERRLLEHKIGYSKTSYTYTRVPIQLMWYNMFSDINEAIKWEKKIKDWSRKKKEALINENWNALVELSKGKNYNEYIRKKIIILPALASRQARSDIALRQKDITVWCQFVPKLRDCRERV